jgi:hypothetical protein
MRVKYTALAEMFSNVKEDTMSLVWQSVADEPMDPRDLKQIRAEDENAFREWEELL